MTLPSWTDFREPSVRLMMTMETCFSLLVPFDHSTQFFQNSWTSWVSSLLPSSSTSDPHFWNQCFFFFFFFFFFFYQCMYLWLWESWGGGEGGVCWIWLGVLIGLKNTTGNLLGYVLKMFKLFVEIFCETNVASEMVLNWTDCHLLAFWDEAGLGFALQ